MSTYSYLSFPLQIYKSRLVFRRKITQASTHAHVQHSPVHKYADINSILIFWVLHTTTMVFKRNKQDVL